MGSPHSAPDPQSRGRRAGPVHPQGAPELAVLSLDADDAVEVLRSLSRIDAACRLRSARAGEWLYVFKPKVGQWIIYLKVAVRDDCIVVSFHENEEDHDDPA